MKKLLMLLVLGLLAAPAFASNQASSANGYGPKLRYQPADTNGNRADSFASGFKVFEDSGSAAAILVTDETGVAPSCGQLRQLCTSAGTGYALALDSNTASGITGNSASALLPQLLQSATAVTCLTIDAQFNKGLVLINSSGTGATYAYWRPCSKNP